jgi:hypothetical protein
VSAGQLARSRLVGHRLTTTLRLFSAKWRIFEICAGSGATRSRASLLARRCLVSRGTLVIVVSAGGEAVGEGGRNEARSLGLWPTGW